MSWLKRLSLRRERKITAKDDPLTTWVPPEGYRAVLDPFHGRVSCPRSDDLLFLRAEWDQPMRARYCDFHPAMNVAGLYWRLFTAEGER